MNSSTKALRLKAKLSQLPNSPSIPYAGTGFVVGEGLLMTNRHVAQLFSQGVGTQIRYRVVDPQ